MNAQLYLWSGGKEQGPYDFDGLQRLFASGQLSRQSYVRPDGAEKFETAGQWLVFTDEGISWSRRFLELNPEAQGLVSDDLEKPVVVDSRQFLQLCRKNTNYQVVRDLIAVLFVIVIALDLIGFFVTMVAILASNLGGYTIGAVAANCGGTILVWVLAVAVKQICLVLFDIADIQATIGAQTKEK